MDQPETKQTNTIYITTTSEGIGAKIVL